MSPLYALNKTRAELESALSSEQNPITRSALRLALDSVVRQVTKAITHHHASVMRVDRQLVSFNGTKQIEVPSKSIKSAMRDLRASALSGKEEHWFWNREEEKESARFGRLQVELQELFHALPDKTLVRLTYGLGGVKKMLATAGFENVLELTETVRKQHGAVLIEVVKKALLQEEKK